MVLPLIPFLQHTSDILDKNVLIQDCSSLFKYYLSENQVSIKHHLIFVDMRPDLDCGVLNGEDCFIYKQSIQNQLSSMYRLNLSHCPTRPATSHHATDSKGPIQSEHRESNLLIGLPGERCRLLRLL